MFKTKEQQHACRNRITTPPIRDSVLSERDVIEEAFVKAYTDLFSEKRGAQPPRLFGEPLQGLSDPIKRQINRPITGSEVEEAIKKPGTTPSSRIRWTGQHFLQDLLGSTGTNSSQRI